MNITLHVDSSYCKDTKALGWGAVVTLCGNNINMSGCRPYRGQTYELVGAIEAFARLYSFIFELDKKIKLEHLTLVVDSDEIKRKHDALPVAHFDSYEIKVVKSHSKITNHDLAMNSHCDSMAKTSMRELRESIRNFNRKYPT